MRKIKENEFVSFTITGYGWSYTITEMRNALHDWAELMPNGKLTLWGNKANGQRAILDNK